MDSISGLLYRTFATLNQYLLGTYESEGQSAPILSCCIVLRMQGANGQDWHPARGLLSPGGQSATLIR